VRACALLLPFLVNKNTQISHMTIKIGGFLFPFIVVGAAIFGTIVIIFYEYYL